MLDVLKSKTVLIALGLALVVGALSALGIEASCRKQIITHQEAIADQHGAAADAHQGQAVKEDAKVDDLKAPLTAAHRSTAAALAKVERLEHALAEEKAKPGPVDMSTALSARDALIAGLRDANGKLIVQAQAQEEVSKAAIAARDEWRTAALERQQESQALRIALNASKADQKRWGAGGSWNPADRTYGVVGEYDFNAVPIRIGAQVFQQRLPILAGGGTKGAAQVWMVVRL